LTRHASTTPLNRQEPIKAPSVDWAVAAAAGVTGETSERGLRLLAVKAGDTIFIDGGAGGVGAVAVQMAVARGATVIASASDANHDYLREIGATPVLYGPGVADRVRAVAGGPSTPSSTSRARRRPKTSSDWCPRHLKYSASPTSRPHRQEPE
jgi:NADPH:quinone reductase-like Zn-dependent oxidoreductase